MKTKEFLSFFHDDPERRVCCCDVEMVVTRHNSRPECGYSRRIWTMYSASGIFGKLAALFIMFGSAETAGAVAALEISSVDVHRASFCLEYSKIILAERKTFEDFSVPSALLKTIREYAEDLIDGGDNLYAVPVGKEDALRRVLSVKAQPKVDQIGAHLKALEICAVDLTAIVTRYREHSCGYGTNRDFGGMSLSRFLSH